MSSMFGTFSVLSSVGEGDRDGWLVESLPSMKNRILLYGGVVAAVYVNKPYRNTLASCCVFVLFFLVSCSFFF